jgi:hypothetical protein
MCSECNPYGGSCPSCSKDVFEEEFVRCGYCYEYFSEQELVKYNGAPACKECAEKMEQEDREDMLRKSFSLNAHELISCLIPTF